MNDRRLKLNSEITVQCWVRRSNFPDEWQQISGGRKSEYSSIKAFKAAMKKSVGHYKTIFEDMAYHQILEISWVELQKTIVKKIITE